MTTKAKIKLMNEGKAYICQCDGGYFFYYNSGLSFKRITKKTYSMLSELPGVWFVDHVYKLTKEA